MVVSINKICRLPIEILHDIITYLPLVDEIRVSRTCRLLNDLCIPVMYRHVSFNSRTTSQAVKCYDVITHKELAARSVRKFTLNLAGEPTACELRWHICLDALAKTASFLTSLCLISSRSLEGSSEITKFIFPQLRELTMSFPDIVCFTKFVDNHPRLVHLTAFLHDPLPRLSYEHLAVVLPMLETFTGSTQLVSLVAQGSRIFRATIMWDIELDASSSDYEHIFNALSQSTVPITHLEFNMAGFGPRAFAAISRSLKALQQIKFRNTHYHNQSNSRLCDMIYTGIESILPEMNCLVRIDIIDDLGLIDLDTSLEEIEMQYRMLSLWSTLCNTLEICTMPPRITWGRFKRSGRWISDLETKVSTTWTTRHCKDIPELLGVQSYWEDSRGSCSEVNLARLLRGDHWKDKRIMMFKRSGRPRRAR